MGSRRLSLRGLYKRLSGSVQSGNGIPPEPKPAPPATTSPKPPAGENLNELAETILKASKTISDYFVSNELPGLSFSKDGPLAFPKATTEIQDARRSLREAAKKINDLVTAPSEHLTWLYNDVSTLAFISRFDVAAAVPLDGEISYGDLAAKVGVNEEQVRRILRYSITNNIFCEPKRGFVTHTAGSRLLIQGGLKDLIAFASDDCLAMAANLVKSIDKFGYTQEMNAAPFNVAFNTDLPIFRYFDQDPVRGPRFARSMQAMGSSDGGHIRHTVNGYGWSNLGEKTVVDVGGSNGHASFAIAEAAPNLKFVVQDLPKIIEMAESSGVPDSLKDRVSFAAHDFFTTQPVKADVYLLRMILHDYPDKYAIEIIRNLLPAMQKGSKIVVVDFMLPPPGVIPPSEERILRIMDMQMMIMLNAKEREAEEWTAIFAAADPALKILRIERPPESVHTVIEVEYQ